MDYTLFKMINGLADKFFILDKSMIFIAQNFQYFFAVTLIALWFMKDTKENVLANRKAAIFALIVMLIAIGINHIIGFIYFRPRPYTLHPAHLLVNPSVDPSFPSDHAAFSFALAFTIFAANKNFGRIMMAMATLLVFSRVYVGIHYPFDIIGGAAIAYVTYRAIRRYPKYFNLIADFILKIWDTIIIKFFKIIGKSTTLEKNTFGKMQ